MNARQCALSNRFIPNTTMNPDQNSPVAASPPALPTRSGWKKPLLVTACVIFGIGAVTAASAAWWYHDNLSASPFRAVQLSRTEAQVLDQKVDTLKGSVKPAEPVTDPAKTLVLSEREINGYLQEQGLGEQFKVSIKNGVIAATALVPVDNEVPVLGGHTVRVKISFNTKLDDKHHMALSLADLSVGGISLPNAWLGNIKGMNVLASNNDDGVLKGFAAGIKDFQVRDGEVRVVLND